MRYSLVFCILCLVFPWSCSPTPGKRGSAESSPGDSVVLAHATGFSIRNFPAYKKLTVRDPWQKSTNTSFEYYLVGQGAPIPPELSGKKVLRTPLKRVICLSTTHIGFLDALGEHPAIAALSGCNYVTNGWVRQRVEENQIREVGYDRGLNYELIVQLKPEVNRLSDNLTKSRANFSCRPMAI